MNLEKIWAEYRTSLKAFLYSKVSNAADVDDLLQEILLKTYQSLAKLRADESIKSWLFQIANHTIIDFYRRNGRINDFKKSLQMEGEASSEVEGENPSGNDVKNELSHCIAPFIQALDRQSSDLLTAIDLNNESQKAYAQSQGISYPTLKSRVQKARRELRAMFEGCCKMRLDAQGNLMDYEQNHSDKGHCGKC